MEMRTQSMLSVDIHEGSNPNASTGALSVDVAPGNDIWSIGVAPVVCARENGVWPVPDIEPAEVDLVTAKESVKIGAYHRDS